VFQNQINRDTLVFRQSPNMGVKTKNSKPILTTFLPINIANAEAYFISWFDYLIEKKGFLPTDPIFPATDKHSNSNVSRFFWTTSGPAYKTVQKRFKEANLPAYNPHSFRHFASACLSEMRLTEIEKKACSMNFGHEDVGTTFGTYGYGNMTQAKAVEIVKKTKTRPKGNFSATPEQIASLKTLLESI
jgi:integrase